jgi:hypothetical protein
VEEFYAEAFAALTPAQVEALSPEEFRGRLIVDHLCATPVWAGTFRPVPYDDPEMLERTVLESLSQLFTVLDRVADLEPIVKAWVSEMPYDALDAFEARSMYRTARIERDTRRTVELLRRVVSGLSLDEERASRARSSTNAFVPLRRQR